MAETSLVFDILAKGGKQAAAEFLAVGAAASKGNDQVALSSRKMALAVKESSDKAAKAQAAAKDAAEKLAKGEITEAEAADKAAKAIKAVEKASIKAAEAQLIMAKAADKAAANQRELARAAELGAAAEDLAMLKASGRVKEHNALILKLRKDMPELGQDGSKAFVLMGSASQSFGKALDGATSSFSDLSGVGRAMPGAVLVGLQLLPAAASIAGGAITLGLGGALTFMALKAQSSNKDVQKSFASTKSAITDDFHHISEPFHKTLLTMSADAKRTWYAMSPTLETAFARMAPAVTRFSSSFADSLRELDPAIESIGNAFSKTLDALGGEMPAIMNNLGTSIKAITDAVAENPQALASFVRDISEVTRYVGDGIGILIKYSSQLKTVFEVANAAALGPIGDLALGFLKLSHITRDSGSGFQTVTKTFPTFAQQAIVAATGTQHLMTAEQAATLTTDQLKAALDRLTGANQSAFDANIQYRQALVAANTQAKHNNAGIEGNSKAALENSQMLSQLAKAIKNVESSGHQSAKQIEGMRQSLISAAQGMGLSRKAAVDLATNLLGIKAPPPIKLSMNDAEFLTKLHRAQGLHIDPKTGLLRGDDSDYFNKWLKSNHLTINTKTGLFQGNNSDYYNKWLKANGLHIDTKTGKIAGNTDAFWKSVHGIPTVVGNRQINVRYVPVNSANQPGMTRHAKGGYIGYATGGVVGFPTGGHVKGPGSGISDSIPAMLSNGEFVINAAQTKKNRALLEAINSGNRGFGGNSEVLKTVAKAGSLSRTIRPVAPRGASAAGNRSAPPAVDVYVDGRKMFQVMQEHGRNYTIRNRKSPFATSVGG